MFEKKQSVQGALKRILGSPHFESAHKLQSILEYVIEEELAGRGENLKAYSIGIDVFGKPESFDPQTDPIVRVNFGRLRTALSLYYSNEGASDPVRIVFKKGSYRPQIGQSETSEENEIQPNTDFQNNPQPTYQPLYLIAAGTLVLAAFFVWVFIADYPSADRKMEISEAGQTVPVIEVPAFIKLPDSPRPYLIDGLRQQLISDLSRFGTVRVRDMSGVENWNNDQSNTMPPASYWLEGRETMLLGERKLLISFFDKNSSNLMWSSTISFPTNDAEFYGLLEKSVRGVVRQIADISGIVQIDSLRRLKQREEKLGSLETSNYECVLIYHQFDLTKSPIWEERARQCLKEKVDSLTLNSSIWAAWSFMLFLDWTKSQETGVKNQAMEAAHRAIRLDPRNASGHEYLGSILLADGQRDKALNAYQRAIELNPSKPDLQITLGWSLALDGDWEKGIARIRQGISMIPAPSGWMYIPLSIHAFQLNDFATALTEAETILQAGDKRGLVLALAAAIALEDGEKVAKYKAEFLAYSRTNWSDPMREIRNVFNDPEIMKKYEKTLQPVLNS